MSPRKAKAEPLESPGSMEVRTEPRELKVPLPEELRASHIETLRDAVLEAEQLEKELKELGKTMREGIREARGRARDSARALKEGTPETVSCQIEIDHAHGQVRVIRLDTGEVAEERPIRPEERQLPLTGMSSGIGLS